MNKICLSACLAGWVFSQKRRLSELTPQTGPGLPESTRRGLGEAFWRIQPQTRNESGRPQSRFGSLRVKFNKEGIPFALQSRSQAVQ